MSDDPKPSLRCSFCNKSQRDVKKLIAGPAAYICDECVDVCNDVLADEGLAFGRGVRAALRAVNRAREYASAARALLESKENLPAAREVRNACLAALRGHALLDGDGADSWSETKVVVRALETHPQIARLLQVDDASHILLRVAIDGAHLEREEIARAANVVDEVIALLDQAAARVPLPERRSKD